MTGGGTKSEEDGHKNSKIEQVHQPCPDGGWGWLVVFASFMIHVIADGVTYSIGLFYYEFVKYFGASKTATSMVVSIMNGTTYCIGPIASALTIKFGCRAVTIWGALFASLGFFCSIFASNIYFLYGTIGICAGFGFGLMYLPAIVIVTSYFEKKRAFATGIAVCGSGIGTAIMSPFIEYIIHLFGLKGAMLVISVLILNCAIFGLLFKPVPTVPIKINSEIENFELQESTRNTLNTTDSCINIQTSTGISDISTKSSIEINTEEPTTPAISIDGNDVKQRSHSFTPGFVLREDTFYSGSLMNIHSHHYKSRSDSLTKGKLQRGFSEESSMKECWLLKILPNEIKDSVIEMIDLSLMKDTIFLIFSISNFLTSIGYFIPYIYLKDWIVEMDIGSAQETGYFTSIIGLFSTISRLVFGYLSDQSFINRLWLYTSSVTLCGLIIISNTLATTHLLLALFCAGYGISCGTYVSLTSVVLVDLLGLPKLTNAFGLILLCQGVAAILGPLFIGFIHDVSGAYNTGFYVIGSIVAFSGIMLILIPLLNHFKSLKNLFLF